jgi:signal recognition particle GTPase
MGTSSMYGGPNRSPLLPPDFNDGDGNSDNPNPQDKPEQQPEENKPADNAPAKNPNENESVLQELSSNNPQYTSWRPAKNSMSKYASGKGGSNGKRNAVSNYVKSHGGSQNAAKSAKSAIRTTISIGDFFGGVKQKGITQVLNDFQIPIEGRKPKEILNDIVNVLAPTPDLNDDSVARKALVNTMSIIYEKFDDEKKDISLLDSLDPDITKVLITKYIETFIYERLIHDVGSRIEKKAENSNAAAKIEKELKDYIETKVSTTLKDKPLSIINSGTKNVNVLVEGLYQQCYRVLEDQL